MEHVRFLHMLFYEQCVCVCNHAIVERLIPPVNAIAFCMYVFKKLCKPNLQLR